MATQVTIFDQLEDPRFKKWLMKVPKLSGRPPDEPWYVYVQRTADGPWVRKSFSDYAEALKFAIRYKKQKGCYDFTIHSKARAFPPPMARSKKTGRIHYMKPVAPHNHKWCPYCRRMTLFRYFRKHPAQPAYLDQAEKRCTICGLRQQSLPKYSKG